MASCGTREIGADVLPGVSWGSRSSEKVPSLAAYALARSLAALLPSYSACFAGISHQWGKTLPPGAVDRRLATRTRCRIVLLVSVDRASHMSRSGSEAT